MNLQLSLAAGAALFVASLSALPGPLGEEEYGNEPVRANEEWAPGVLEVANDADRVYRRWVNGNEDFLYRGNDAALNDALKLFARIEAPKREVFLLPLPGADQDFDGKAVAFDWRLSAPSGIYKHRVERGPGDPGVHTPHATLWVHASAERGPSALEFPTDVAVFGPDELVRRCARGVKAAGSEDGRASNVYALARFEYVPAARELLESLSKAEDEPLRRSAEHALKVAKERGKDRDEDAVRKRLKEIAEVVARRGERSETKR